MPLKTQCAATMALASWAALRVERQEVEVPLEIFRIFVFFVCFENSGSKNKQICFYVFGCFFPNK